ncbi:hypothetical protein [Legionella sp. WA2022007384]
MPGKEIQEDFLTTPIKEYSGDLAPNLSDEELSALINKMESYLNTASSSELEQSNFLYWLTYGLSNAMKNNRFSSSVHIATLFHKISEKHPHTVISMFGKTIEAGEFKGQTGVFVWTDRFYGATFNTIFSPVIVVMNLIFSTLLEYDSKALSLMMAKPIESGFTSGTNALLNLIYALKNASEYDYNQSTTNLIAELLTQFITRSPEQLGFAITQEVSKGIFSGTSLIDFVVAALAQCSKDNIDAVKTLCKMFILINQNHPHPLMSSLTKITQSGYNQGMNSFHILLTTLVSATYIENNTEMVNLLVVLIHELLKKSHDKVIAALTQPIHTGEREGENGIMHLVHALIISMERNIDTTAITNLLLEVIESNGNELTAVFNSHAISKSTHYFDTPLSKLESKLKSEHSTSAQKAQLENIVSKLTDGISPNHYFN